MAKPCSAGRGVRVPYGQHDEQNAIRPTAVGKKNWLFFGHPEAGERSAIIYSILISCQRLEIPLQAYLMDVLRHSTHTLGQKEIRQLTPKNWHKRNCQGG